MAVDFIGGATQATANGPDLSQNAVSQQDFLNVMLTQLRFQATEGVSAIDRVFIRFGDGHWQVAEIGKRLDAGTPMVEVPLEGLRRNIDQIIVTGSSGRRGSYQVFGI